MHDSEIPTSRAKLCALANIDLTYLPLFVTIWPHAVVVLG